MAGNGIISHKGKKRLITRKSSVKASKPETPLNLVELPMDIIFEIFGHLEPLDLLQALETCRPLHNLLTAGAPARVIWSRARANIPGLPDCPDDLSEVDYARLVFETHCQACHQGKSYELRTIRVWAARARYCSPCFDANFVQEKLGRKRKKVYPDEVKALLPSRLGWHHHLSICQSLDELWGKEYKRLKTEEDRRNWTNTKIAERRKINVHAMRCEIWYEFWEKEKVRRRVQQVESRKERILARLRALGWEEEMRINASCEGLLVDRRVRRACEQDLTEEALCDVVEYLDDYLHQAKEVRLSHTST